MPLEQNLERICISIEFHLSLPVLESSVLLFHIFLAPLQKSLQCQIVFNDLFIIKSIKRGGEEKEESEANFGNSAAGEEGCSARHHAPL